MPTLREVVKGREQHCEGTQGLVRGLEVIWYRQVCAICNIPGRISEGSLVKGLTLVVKCIGSLRGHYLSLRKKHHL